MVNYCSIDDCKKCNKYKCICLYCITNCNSRFYDDSGRCLDYVDWIRKITRAEEIKKRKKYWWKRGYY